MLGIWQLWAWAEAAGATRASGVKTRASTWTANSGQEAQPQAPEYMYPLHTFRAFAAPVHTRHVIDVWLLLAPREPWPPPPPMQELAEGLFKVAAALQK